MMERFGMKLITPDGKDLCWFEGRIGFWVPYPFEGGTIEGKRLLIESLDPHFIHPDSLHLLEPQAGDFWQDRDLGGVLELVRDRLLVRMPGMQVLDAKRGDWVSATGRIIQRNGMAFHWPESEAA
jgi:hypothetical protein